MFKDCTKLSINLFGEDMTLYANHHTHWIYICLYTKLRVHLEADFMNELITTLKNQHYITVKGFSSLPGRVDAYLNEVEVLCMFFEQDHSVVRDLVSESTERVSTSEIFNFNPGSDPGYLSH